MARADLTTALRNHVLADATVRSMVETRLRPDALNQGEAYPAARYHVLTDRRENGAGGASTLRMARVQYDCYAMTRTEADRLGFALEDALTDLSGLVGDVFIDDCVIDNNYAHHDKPPEGGDAKRYIRTLDVEVSYQATAAEAA